MAKMPPGPFTKGRTGTPAFRPVGSANKLPIGNYTKGKPGTPAYRPVGVPRLGGELPPVNGKKTNAIPRVGGGGGGGVLRTRTPRPPRASSTSMKGGGGVQGMSKPRPYSTSMGGAGTSVQAVSGPRTKTRKPTK